MRGSHLPMLACYIGHGGTPTSDWLESSLSNSVDRHCEGSQCSVQSITKTFMQVCPCCKTRLAAMSGDSAVHMCVAALRQPAHPSSSTAGACL